MGREDRVFLWLTATLILLFLLTLVAFAIQWFRSSFSCALVMDAQSPCLIGSIDVGDFLVGAEALLSIVSNLVGPFLSIIQLGWAVLAIRWLGRWFRRHADWANVRSSRWRIIAAAIAATVIGLAPMASSLSSEVAASRLGCFVNEHGAYTDLGEASLRICMWGTTDVGPLLHDLHMSVMGFIFTWPLIPIAIYLWFCVIRAKMRGSHTKRLNDN